MAHAIKNLGDVAGHTLRERLGATIERMKEAVPFIDTERDVNAKRAQEELTRPRKKRPWKALSNPNTRNSP